MVNREDDLKKRLAEALMSLGVDISEDIKEKKDSDDEEHEDYTEMSMKTKNKIEDLNQKEEEIFKKTGMTKESLMAYGENPNNFNKDQWEALQKIKEVAEEYKAMAQEGIVETLESAEVEEEEKKKMKKEQKRLTKRKDWIPL